jgi:oxygen-independent coproporphyrinogen-3 oxidase
LKPLPEETEIAMAELVEARAAEAGLARYEISNHARPGRESRHNSNYWEGGDYLGIGAGAHSYESGAPEWGRRWHNVKRPEGYIREIALTGQALAGEERGDYRQAAGEFMFLGLRMIDGISTERFARRFAMRPEDLYPQLTEWIEEGFLARDGTRLRLTLRGLLVANSIFASFV